MRVGAGVLNCGIITSYLIFISFHINPDQWCRCSSTHSSTIDQIATRTVFWGFHPRGDKPSKPWSPLSWCVFLQIKVGAFSLPNTFHCHRFHSCDFKFIFKCYKVPSIVFLINWTPLQNWVSLLKAPPAKRCAPLFNSRVPKLLSRGHDYRGVWLKFGVLTGESMTPFPRHKGKCVHTCIY